MKKIILSLIVLSFSGAASAQIFIAKNCDISFFSSSPLEDIEAVNKACKPIINTATNDVQMKIAISAFQFEKPLMQEHFNENYMETEKFPNAVFKGKINEKVDWTKDGEYKVTVTGKLLIHGVEKDRTLDGLVKVKGQEINISSKFKIHIEDHGIKVPSLYVQNIAEDVEVKLNANLEPYKK
ncbi:MAG TPA: YceI family protein [Bacteroidia bacterium]|jgi:CO dehydrogenase/acetyl-CoA synthase gamma subunit (corrinoid Fe-S protein)